MFYRKTNKTAKTETSFNQNLTKQSFRPCSITLLPSIKKTSASLISLRNLFNFFHTWQSEKLTKSCEMIKQSHFSSMYNLLKLSQNHFTYVCMCVVTKSCPTLCDLMDCSPPGSSVHVISQARILEWVVIYFSKGSSRPRD